MNLSNLQKKVDILHFHKLNAVTLLLIFLNILTLFPLFGFLQEVHATSIDLSELVALTNESRIKEELTPLIVDPRLEAAAKAKAQDMLLKDYWNHYGPDGETPWQFILASGYEYLYAGENLAKNFTTAGPIHEAWLESKTHRENILGTHYTNIGVAAISGTLNGESTILVVQMFGRELELPNNQEQYNNSESLLKPVEDFGDVSIPVPFILQPSDGEITDDAAFTIRGEAHEADKVEVFLNQDSYAMTDIQNNIFTYTLSEKIADGVYSLWAKSLKGQDESFASEPIGITVDTVPPQVDTDSLTIYFTESQTQHNGVYHITLDVFYEPVSVILHTSRGEYTLSSEDKKVWSGRVEASRDNSRITVQAVDSVGNESNTEITSEFAGKQAGRESGEYQSQSLLGDVISRLSSLSPFTKINVLFVILILFALVFDSIVVFRHNLTRNTSKSLLHIPIFILLLFLVISGIGEIR